MFPSQLGKLRDRFNTNADLREAMNPLGFGWVSSHNFRKTAATLLDEAGLTVREIADQLGHKRVSTTLDTSSAAVPRDQPAKVENPLSPGGSLYCCLNQTCARRDSNP